jgi:hypothetical protein
MIKVADLYSGGYFTALQTSRILSQVSRPFLQKEDKVQIAKHAIGELSWSYSTGGISAGRSLRSVVLDEAISCLNSDLIEETKELIAVLLAMYHSADYINKKNWYDYHVTMESLPVQHRIWLLTIAYGLNVTEMPDITTCTDEYIFALVATSKTTRRKK